MSRGPAIDRVREVLDLALERPSRERDALVAGLCAGDDPTREEVLSLLRALESEGDPLAGGPGEIVPPQEPLTGLTFGSYRVVERIGAGGMGVVYRAEDTRLGRDVAVKALPPALARDPHRRARFEHEARVLASLNHPNIAAIHGVEDTPRGPVMVLEFVPGRTLAERLARGALPLEEAVAVAAQVTRGLEAAHAAGVIHRDLKPANVKVTPEGAVKILDFGIAKSVPPPPGMAHLVAAAADPGLTHAGGMIGTASYMSPEQARGAPVDRRTDLWAFGCVLYEMLTGRRAFDGGTTSDTVAAVLRGEPDWSSLPAGTPEHVGRLLRRCLEKDPDRRQRDAGDARLELESAPLDPEAQYREDVRARRARMRAIAVGGALLVVGAAAGVVIMRARGGAEPAGSPLATPARFVIDVPLDAPLAPAAGGCLALSPDGRTLAYSAGPWTRGLFLRRLDAFEAVEVPGTSNAHAPFFSPDGRWIAYCDLTGQSPRIKRVRVDGGVPEVVAEAVEGEWASGWATGGSWGTDGTIVFGGQQPRGLRRVPAAGGVPTDVTRVDASKGEVSHVQPCVLPGCDAILFTNCLSAHERFVTRIEAVRPGTGERRIVLEDAAQPMFLGREGGRLLFYRADALWSIGFDPASLVASGEPERVLSPIAGGEYVPYTRVAVSPGGTLAYLPERGSHMDTELAWFDRNGSSTKILDAGRPIHSLRLSPDGKAVAFASGVPTHDIWVHDLARATTTRLSKGGGCFFPIWTPGGRRVAFQQQTSEDGPSRVMWVPADGSSAPEVLFEPPRGEPLFPSDFARNGSLAITMQTGPEGEVSDIFLVEPGPDRSAHRLFKAGADRVGVRFSPDETLVAYASAEAGKDKNDNEIYIQPFPALDRKVRVSVDGGIRPAWSHDGRRLFFKNGDIVYEADVTASPELIVSAPRVVVAHLSGGRFDVSPDGERIITTRPKDWGVQTRINIVLGWDGAAPHPGGVDGSSIGR